MFTTWREENCLLHLQLFFYLQVLDFLTTLVGFRLGAVECAPFTRHLLRMTPEYGVALDKLTAVLLAIICYRIGRPRVIGWINTWFAALVVWNLCVILLLRH